MTTDEMIKYLQGQYGNIGEITTHIPTAEERSNAMSEGMGPTYGLSNPALRQTIEGGPGLSNIRPAAFGGNQDPIATEYGVIPSEQTATPTSYRADLTTPDKEGYYYTGDFDPTGKMVGAPKREKYEADFMRKHGFELGALLVGGAAFLPMAFGAGAGSGVTAASLGELGINTGLTVGETLAGTGISEAALGELGINTGLTAAQTAEAAAAANALSAPWYQPIQQGFQSFQDLTNVGKYFAPDAPAWAQRGITDFSRGLLTSGGDPEAALRAGISGGISGFGDFALPDLPPEARRLVESGVSTAIQGGDLESVLRGAAFGTITSNVSSAITGATGSKWAGEVATNAIKQALTGGNIDPKNITVSTLAQLAGRAVGAETGNESLGRAATTAVLGAIKGKDLDDILKQVAMGALTTPAKKGG